MATKNIEIQDSTGNIYYPHTDASIVKFGDSNVNATLSDIVYQTAGGSATAITLTIRGTLVNGYPITFIASINNGGAATTINGKKLYKPGTTTSPNLMAGKAYTVWYNSTGDCFFIKASAEGTALASDVRKDKTFSNNNDAGIVGGLDLSLLVPGNIRAGITIDGVTGKSSIVDTADTTASAAQILNGSTVYVNGNKVTGTMINRNKTGDDMYSSAYPTQPISKAAQVIYGLIGLNNPSAKLVVCPAPGYYAGDTNEYTYVNATDVATAIGLTAAKLTKDANVLGITGTAIPVGGYADLGNTQYDTPVIIKDTSHYLIYRVIFDSAGNYYTAGRGGDSYVRKFSPNGTLLWQTATNGDAIDIAFDPTESYIYTAEDGYSVRKLACSNGAQIWVYYDPESSNWIYAVDVDSAGNVYAGGALGKIYKLSSNGGLVLTINAGNTSSIIHPRSLSIDSAGNVWAAVGNYINKYSPSGSKLNYYTASSVVGLVIDGLDNIYYITDGVSSFQELHVVNASFQGGKRCIYGDIYFMDVDKSSNTVVITTKDNYNLNDAYVHRFDSLLRQLGSINFQSSTTLLPVGISKTGVIAVGDNSGNTTIYKPRFKIL
ncbi:periplasmic ligand-binding sensor protein [Clostridium beijerinckii]|jgi:hypothetical protein|uniref:Putative periplasmic ligand-binding sensor protein n=1 Tax=Clostridium beijerinckii (strain ATCC 51743 / NCIMB 8052) TaxID=290402 RepID=A6LYT2_CLOB8|nr:periplasmic ligand-binding sensor protein [Clostridium beijerinckii]ABR35512.1 putative periplasmic ligand-binding sensor protein [Clostridium beijerinckii NCIMB 8052]AIU01379.1 putative periplasmic ligand-binding sensor protein [Clostridium beijerinckii ATCC 35702]NRT69363.1 hypothetical protein [Clostridium beijerinckii]NRT84489.1 hypothetical protein [Clostridium beijerinckii]NRU48951.1 hypothetical protein [Clostridium beijerinckii]